MWQVMAPMVLRHQATPLGVLLPRLLLPLTLQC